MKSLRLSIEYTDETIHPMHAFVCKSPAIEREVLLEGKREGAVRTLLFYVEGDADAYETALETHDRVGEYEVRPAGNDGLFVYVRAPNEGIEKSLFEAFERETVVVAGPIEFLPDRTMQISLVGHGSQLEAVVNDLPDELDIDVLEVGSYDRAVGPGLTERQREALEAAWEIGYYAVPREGDIEAVAAHLDCAVSTASALLRRAERGLVADAIGVR